MDATRSGRAMIGISDTDSLSRLDFLIPIWSRDYAAIHATGVFTNHGPVEERFAAELARWIGNDVAVSVTSSATAAIQLACRALFRSDRRFVIVASFTAPMGPLAVRWSGYEPVLIDIDRDSWQPDARAARALLAQRDADVAGILLTSTRTADPAIEQWETLAREHEVGLVIDSAPGFGSAYPSGELLGARGDCEIFSFHATKVVAIGEGGAVAARNHAVIEQIDMLKNFGFDDTRRSVTVGLNAKLPELASAMGLRQLEVLDKRLAKRREVLGWYAERLEAFGCELQPGVHASTPTFVSTLLPPQTSRVALGRALDSAGIGWRAYFDPPVHQQPSFAGVRIFGELSVTEEVAGRIISLPLDDEMSTADVDRIVAVVAQVVDG